MIGSITKSVARPSVLAVFGLVLAAIVGSCTNPGGAPYPNTFPKTRLANIPANDTIAQYILLGVIPEQTLFWVGDDPDGFVVAYRYRWINFHQTGYDSAEWRSILNLTNLSGTQLDTLIEVHKDAGSLSRIYNFFATIDPNNRALITSIQRALAIGEWFAVPYAAGGIAGDSVRGADPVEIEAPTKGIFIFDSPADSNQHRFEVKAVDNDDAEDPDPPFVHFWTLRSPSPLISFINGPGTFIAGYVLSTPTDLAPGMTFTFGARDPSTDEREFSWTVDDTTQGWSPWSRSNTAIVTALNLMETGSDTHIFYVQAKNRWGSVSPIDTKYFRALVPEIDRPGWPRRTLFINNCRTVGAGGLDTGSINSFYRNALTAVGKGDSMDVWTSSANPGGLTSFPPLSLLLRYTNVVLVAENTYPIIGAGSNLRITSSKQDVLRNYLFLGGKLIYPGAADIRNLFQGYEGFFYQIFHVETLRQPFLQNNALDFIGSRGLLGYPDIHLDSTKVPADSGYALRRMAVNFPRGFGETISLFRSKNDIPEFADRPLGVRYLAEPPPPPLRPTYSVVYFGLPTYYARPADVAEAFRVAFIDINESSIP